MPISKPFVSENQEMNQLLDWIVRNFAPIDVSYKSLLRQMVPGSSADRDSGQMNGEMRYRMVQDALGDFLQPVVHHNGAVYPFPAAKVNNGQLRFVDKGTVWDDLRVEASSVRVTGATNTPAYATWRGNLQLLRFDASTMEQVFFQVQLPHMWKEGSKIHPHVHWTPVANGVAGRKVSWGLEYIVHNIGETTPASTTTIYGNTHTPADSELVQYRHYLTPIGSGISMVGKTVSCMLSCRLFRDATGAGATDDYTSDAGLLEFDFHYEKDTLGSDEEYTK